MQMAARAAYDPRQKSTTRASSTNPAARAASHGRGSVRQGAGGERAATDKGGRPSFATAAAFLSNSCVALGSACRARVCLAAAGRFSGAAFLYP